MPDNATAEYAKGLARAFGGSIIFASPLLMTMEMWQLGFYMDPLRLALLILVSLPILVGLSYFAGFEETLRWKDDVMDGLSAFGVGFVAAAAALALFGILTPDMPISEIVGKIGVAAVPASIGAILARKQMGASKAREERRRRQSGYAGELFLMMTGAVFVCFNVAPTEEMVLIAYKITPWHASAMVLASLLILHAFVYTVGFAGEEEPRGQAGFWRTFFNFTVVGYAIALLVSVYMLWTFERTAGMPFSEEIMVIVVLGFPAALGAAIARLVV